MTSPPSWQPKQWQNWRAGVTWNDGDFSSWKGHRPFMRATAGVAEGDVAGDDVVDARLLAHLRDVVLTDPPGHARSLCRAAHAGPAGCGRGPRRVAPLRVVRLRAARRQDGLMTFSDPVDTQVSGPGPVPARTEEPTLGALVHDLTQQVPELIRSELRLAQAEVTEKGKRAGLGIGMFSVAGLLALLRGGRADHHRDPGARPGPARLARRPHRGGRPARRRRRRRAGRQEAGGPGDAAQARAGHRGRQGRHRDRQGSTGDDASPTPEQLEAEIEVQRDQLADTVDQLAQKLDVKAQAKASGSAAITPTDVRRVRRRRGPASVASSGGGAGDEPARAPRASTGPSPPRPTPTTRASPTPRPTSRSGRGGTSRRKVLARVRRRPVHRPGGGADLLRRPRHLPGRAGPQRHPRAGRPVGEVGADGPRRAQPPRLRGRPRHHRAHAAASSPSSQTAGLGAARSVRVLALWSASGYVGAFGRAMNRIYEIGEGRPVLEAAARSCCSITLVAIVLVALVLLMLVVSRPAGPVDRRPDRPGRPGGPGLEHRQVAGDGAGGDA